MENANSKIHEFDDKKEVDKPTVRVTLLPELVPDAENLLKRCLTQEIELYLSNAQSIKMSTMLFQSIF